MNIQTDASKITQAELDHIHRMTKIDRVGRINAQARAAKMRKQARILREVLADNLQAWEGEEESVREEHADLIEETRAALEATKEEE